jgi:hypothetical protein
MPGLLETGRLKALSQELRPGSGPCPFVIDEEAAELVSLSHFNGGRDVAYVVVARQPAYQSESRLAVTIRYAPFIEGTTIIYDATEETMQGKARPFVCKLGELACRVYAVMPVQIEETAIQLDRIGSDQRLRVAFCNACGEVIEGTLPFELQLVDSSGVVRHDQQCATDRRGRYQMASAPGDTEKVIVRSLLTGREATLPLPVGE